MKDIVEGAELARAAFDLEVAGEAVESRSVRLSFSSEKPYLREDGWEVLGHQPGEADLTRLVSGTAPLLKDHKRDIDSMVGTVESAEIIGGRGQAVVRFAESADGEKMLERVRSGEVKCVSVGYRVHDYKRSGERDGLPIIRVTKWEPYEISLVAVPADETVGVGRSAGRGERITSKSKECHMTTETTATPPEGNSRSAVHQERTRIAEIQAIGRHFEIGQHEIDDAIENGTSTDRFRTLVLDQLSDGDQGATRAGITRINIASSQERPYSLTRTINAELTGDWSDAGFERECAQEMKRSIGRSPEGIYVPPVALATRDLLTTSNASSLIGTEHMGNAFIDALKPETHVMQLGATVLSGLRENVSIPKMGAGTQAEWIAEDTEATESTPNFGNVTIALKQLSAHARLTRRMLKQSVPMVDVILQNELRRQIAVAVDAAAISGAGTALEPQGILSTPGIGDVEIGVDGGAITWSKVTELMAAVEGANIPMNTQGFLSNPRVKSTLLSTPKFAGGDTAILSADTEAMHIAGTRSAFTTNVPSNLTKGTGTNLSALIFGAWSELLIGQWGGIDIIIDDKSEATKGNVRIVAHSEWDISVRHAEAFAAIKDIDTA